MLQASITNTQFNFEYTCTQRYPGIMQACATFHSNEAIFQRGRNLEATQGDPVTLLNPCNVLSAANTIGRREIHFTWISNGGKMASTAGMKHFQSLAVLSVGSQAKRPRPENR